MRPRHALWNANNEVCATKVFFVHFFDRILGDR
jgi:hypothetical protein